MSRVHEALKRAAAEAGEAVEPIVLRPEPADAPFMSPWAFDEVLPERPPAVRRTPAPAAVQTPARLVPATRPPEDGGHAMASAPVSVPPSGERGGAAQPAPAAMQLESLLAMKWPQPFSPEVAGKLVVTPDTNPAAVEQYHRLAEQVAALQRERGVKVLLVASAEPGEGKSLTATNLGMCLAEPSGRRVLLVDANMPRPGLHRIFQVSAGRGVPAGLPSAIELTRGLALVPGGRGAADPAQIPDAGALKSLLDAARPAYDWILVEAPAVSLAPGVRALAELADATLLVASPERGSPKAVQEAIELIGRERIAGLVVNHIPAS